MKTKKYDLDEDFIGGLDPLTPAEEKAISEYIAQSKLTSKRTQKQSYLKHPDNNSKQQHWA